jgi:DNA ligase (NAD+)
MKLKLNDETINEIKNDPKAYAEKASAKELEKLLRFLTDAYYNKNTLVSDKIFDIMKDMLYKKDPSNKFLSEVGAKAKGEKIKLPFVMGSLEKIKPEDGELTKWLKKYKGPYVISDKLDGTSAQLYKTMSGELKLYTRGNGTIGTDVSHLLPFVLSKSVKTELIPNGASVRGEFIIQKKAFEKIEHKFKGDSRSAINGLINSKTVDKDVAKLAGLVVYSVLNPRYKKEEQLKKLEEWGFNVVWHTTEKELDEEKLAKYLLNRHKNSDYYVDGIVVDDGDKKYDLEEGRPDHAFAFKMDMEKYETEVLEVVWEASMDGYLKPVVRINPVVIDKSTVKKATAHNAKYVVDNNIGPGSKIKVIKSGGVIPKIYEVVTSSKSGKPQLPDVPYKWNATNVDLVVKDMFGAQKDIITIKKMSHFFSTLGVLNISESTITKLVDKGYDTIAKILKADKEELAEIEGLGEKSITKIFNNIEVTLSNTDLATFMGASHLGRGLGVRKIKLITATYPNIMNEKWDKKELTEKILEIKGFSDKMTKKFVDGFDEFKKFFEEINKIINISHLKKPIKTENKNNDNKGLFEGKIVIFTGFRDEKLEKFIESNGGKVSTSVSGKTSLVVYVPDSKGESSKVTKAKELNIQLMTKDEFIKKYM